MLDESVKYIKNYLLLFWGIAWRTFALAVATSILSGIGLGILVHINQWPPTFIQVFAPMIGTPITLLVGAYIVWKQVTRMTRQTIKI